MSIFDGAPQVGDVIRKTSARVLKEGKSGDYAKKGHGAPSDYTTSLVAIRISTTCLSVAARAGQQQHGVKLLRVHANYFCQLETVAPVNFLSPICASPSAEGLSCGHKES